MSQYIIHSERLIETITLLKSCQQQLKNAERSIYKYENPLSFQAMTDVSRILCNMKNVRQKLNSLNDDLIALQKALIYIGDKSEDADRQVSNILCGRGYRNGFDDTRDTVNDFMKHFQGWFDSDSKDTGKDNDVIYVEPVHTIVLNPDSSPDEIERVEIPENKAEHNGKNYQIAPGFSTDYCYNQQHYSRFKKRGEINKGCTATAMCIAYAIYHNTHLDPNTVKWSPGGTSWEYVHRYKEGGREYGGNTFTQTEALRAAYNCITNGKPMIVYVNGAGMDHVVTIVGIREGADINSLSLGDFLIVDPLDGAVSSLDKYTSIDCTGALRVPND